MIKHSFIRKLFIVIIAIVMIVACVLMVALVSLQIRTNVMLNDYTSVYENEKYQNPVYADSVTVVKQDISCGYAVIEMFSMWNQHENGKDHDEVITEERLFETYGKVVTSRGQSFCDEMNKQFPNFHTTMHRYLTNTALLDTIYDCLSRGIPVPFEWAAQYENNGVWTLHYSLITGLDIANDTVVVANPYGYVEELPLAEFLNRTSFEAYSGMPLYFKLAFAFGIFEKNTAFVVS